MELRSSRILLRDLTDDDYETTQVYASNPNVVRHMAWGPNSPDETRDFLGRAQATATASPRTDFEFAIVERGVEANRHVGGCGVMGRRLVHCEYEVGYCLAEHAWGRGLVSEAVTLMLGFAFGEMGAHRLYACIDPANTASQNVVEKAGFRLEGRQRRDTLIEGEWRDSLIYALVSDEYK